MYDYELERILRGCQVTQPFFLGVIAPKDLNKLKSNQLRYCFILGTTNSFRKSGHWVAVYVNDKVAYVFCSYGTHPHQLPRLKAFLRNFNHVYFNKKMHQNLTSIVCGGYCCYVLHQLCLGVPFVKILKKFQRLKRDDLFVKRFMRSQFGFNFE